MDNLRVLVETCLFADTGKFLKVQAMLHHCNEHIKKKKQKDFMYSYGWVTEAPLVIETHNEKSLSS